MLERAAKAEMRLSARLKFFFCFFFPKTTKGKKCCSVHHSPAAQLTWLTWQWRIEPLRLYAAGWNTPVCLCAHAEMNTLALSYTENASFCVQPHREAARDTFASNKCPWLCIRRQSLSLTVHFCCLSLLTVDKWRSIQTENNDVERAQQLPPLERALGSVLQYYAASHN